MRVAHACAVYADQWLPNCNFSCQVAFLEHWYTSHLAEAQRVGKPLLLEEFACDRILENRDSLYALVYGITAATAVQPGNAVGGTLFWLLAGTPTVPDYDGYTVYSDRDAGTVALVRQQSECLASLVNSSAPCAAYNASVVPPSAAAAMAPQASA